MISVIIPHCNLTGLRERAYIKQKWAIEDQTFRDFEIVPAEVKQNDDIPFNKGMCINHAVRKSNYDNLLFLDADVIFGSDFFQTVADFIQDKKMFMAFDKVILTKGRDNPEERIHNNDLLRACALAWFFKKEFFWEIGGMNEDYAGYGDEDRDIYIRAEYCLDRIPEMGYTITHHYHHWHQEGSCYSLNPDRVKLLNITKGDIRGKINQLVKDNNKKFKLNE